MVEEVPLVQNEEYLQAFLEESQENVQTMGDLCLRLEQQGPSDDLFAAMFRAAHTLKGMSASMGFTRMATLTHRLEDLLGVLRSHPSKLTAAVTDALFEGIDHLSVLLNQIISTHSDEGTADEEPIAQLTVWHARLTEANANSLESTHVAASSPHQTSGRGVLEDFPEESMTVAMAAQAEGLLVGVLTVCIHPSCPMKAVRALLVLRELEQMADCLGCVPSANDIQEGKYDSELRWLVALTGQDEAPVLRAIENISEVTAVRFDVWDGEASGGKKDTGSPLLEKVEKTAPVEADHPGIPPKRQSGPVSADGESVRLERTIRVPVERMDVLLNLLSEFVIARTSMETLALARDDAELTERVSQLTRISGDIQSGLMSLRMVPVDTLFQRFPRLVRDLSKSLKKDIRLELSGGDTELDRTVIDEMGEALVHLIRNAADHGIESAEQRLAKGKSAHGTMRLVAYSSGQNVYLEVSDDGAGINAETVLAKGVERGLVDAETAKTWKPGQIYGLLFASGFSTAAQVTDISGRGVGLDAVKAKVESLSGRISIDSELGRGTTFRIQLPLTLAVLPALLFTVQKEQFAVPLGSVDEVIYVEKSDLDSIRGERMLKYREKVLPLVDLSFEFYGERTSQAFPWPVLICREGNRAVGLIVENLMGEQEIVNKPLGSYLKHVEGFSGATILGDGSMGLILDLHQWAV